MSDDLMRSTLDTIRQANRVRRERDEWKQKAIAVDGRIRGLEGERDAARAQVAELQEAGREAIEEADDRWRKAEAQVAALQDAIGTDDEIEAYIHSLQWGPGTTDLERTLVAGNIRAFHEWIKDRAGGDGT